LAHLVGFTIEIKYRTLSFMFIRREIMICDVKQVKEIYFLTLTIFFIHYIVLTSRPFE